MKRKVALLLACLISACCDSESPRVDDHYSFGECCLLEITSVEGRGLTPEKVEVSNLHPCKGIGQRFEAMGLVICAEAEVKSFHVDIANKTGHSLLIDIPASRILNERGAPMDVYAYELATVPPLDWQQPKAFTLSDSESISLVVLPIKKSYWVASGCRDGVWYNEPLLPESLEEVDGPAARAAIQEMLADGEDVQLVLSLKHGESPVEIKIGASLYDRWKQMRDAEASSPSH